MAHPGGASHAPKPEGEGDGDRRRARLRAARLYLCTPNRPDLGEFVAAVGAAGVDIVQLRDKVLPDRALLERAAVARDAAHAAGALFVLNDRPDLALACDADGVHVGQDDVPAAVARRIVGPDRLVGLSTHAADELAASAAEPVDYVSAGPVEPTPTKPGRPGTGLDYIRRAAGRSPHPFFVTGGVSPATLPAIAAAGATRFVVVRALTESPDPATVAAALRRLIDDSWP
ncbi:MAG TPA: thiamine phosphate synthase [Acidimicrobiia bacterium]|nr:thiamine phosphate synthase [Acidimicrobiia bacterium]